MFHNGIDKVQISWEYIDTPEHKGKSMWVSPNQVQRMIDIILLDNRRIIGVATETMEFGRVQPDSVTAHSIKYIPS